MADIAPVKKKAHWQLTPHPVRSCWRKKFDGKPYYVGKGTTRYTEDDYKRAWEEWEALEAKLLDAKREASRYEVVDGREQLTDAARGDDLYEKFMAGKTSLGSDMIHNAIRRERERNQPQAGQSVGDTVEKFLAVKTAQSRTGRLKGGGRKANLQSNLKTFKEAVGASKPAVVLGDASTLADYYAHLLNLVADEAISSTTAAEKMQAAKQLIRWAWGLGLCELPRNIDSREMVIFRSAAEVKPMPVDTLRTVVRSATGRLKLTLLLMANCGFYQSDAAELLHSEVDYKAGTITRKRSKRQQGKDGDVPVVTYYLWPSTLDLLRQHASTDNVLVLPNDNGVAAVRNTIDANGGVSRTDNFRMAYDRLWDKIHEKHPKAEKWPAKSIRKAGATAIGGNRDFKSFAQYFLGQSSKTVADKHYVRPSESEFKATLDWLGQHFDLYEPEKVV